MPLKKQSEFDSKDGTVPEEDEENTRLKVRISALLKGALFLNKK